MGEALHGGQPLQLFLLYLQMGEELSGLFMADPSLPDELLPHDWPGKRIIGEMSGHAARLAAALPQDSLYAQFVRAT
ncbi:hypothetical protein D3C73_1580470 [compost metagenome]